MNTALENIKSSIRLMQAYHLKERHCPIKLNQNESPYDVPDWLKAEILAEVKKRSWNRYPAFGNRFLVEKLAAYSGSAPGAILVGNGSNELLQLLITAVISKGKRVLLVTPTFAIYQQLARVAEAEIVEVELEKDWSFPVQRIVSACQGSHFDLCILCSPNSPTGSVLDEQPLAEILQATSGLVLLDEAYHEFSTSQALDLLPSHPNLIITRTFSKAVGLAGLRIGYLLADPNLVVELNKAQLPYNLNLFSELVARKLLDNREVIAERIRQIKSEKERILARLAEVTGVTVFPSSGNFYLLKTRHPAALLFEKLVAQGVLTRDVSGYHRRLQDTLRVSVGTPEENDGFFEALKMSLAQI
ncbi:MAG: histidinol-phosphate transaminase [bacterium]